MHRKGGKKRSMIETDAIDTKLPEDNQKEGMAMTKWWLLLTFLVVIFTYGHDILGKDVWFNCLRGAVAVSGLCVGIGYYAFMITFNYVQTPTLLQQFYERSWKDKGYTFYGYVAVDVFIHVLCCGGFYVLWRDYVTVTSTCLTFIFHRLWSLVNSGWTTPYFQGDEVYQFNKRMPLWGWGVVYGVENSICLIFLIILATSKDYY